MNPTPGCSRRGFLRSAFWGGLGFALAPSLSRSAAFANENAGAPAQVALVTGNSRSDLAFRALEPFARELRRAIGGRRVIVKPNNVSIDTPLSATHADTLEGILEFLKSIGKAGQTIIAESAASGPTLEGFENYGYPRVTRKYKVRLVDLDPEPFDVLHLVDERDLRPRALRVSRLLLDPDAFIISAARLKTHDRVVATLSLKNVVVGAPIKDPGFRWGNQGTPGAKNDKPITHGGGFRAINFNLFSLAQRLHPHLALIDGFEGMQGNGPVGGSPVDHRVCVASPDWLAADRVAVELMGIDFAKIGYLNFCAQAGFGQADLDHIDILGERVAQHRRTYRLHDNLEQQLVWMQPVPTSR